ncbi:LrgB family protein [Enterococcus faecium]|uniref:LrgB family protein n=1 Tax=Enterococcus faecium TaxID=1352 RepID=UPI0018C22D55|nr:LrgB family protein [Enterococcus faecium]MBG0446763.1 LrgB family protein [Enterococcus faecium]MBG0460657.1 LrgB family protein [Enterococcus faecium]MBG7673075.1 LrgB family protein [Enterococcus faecium]MBG7960244.1 LrgB family protein [Enterococcus faecium]MBJ0498052.1 LrgB family protein [Enterococcus faecium]
MTEFFVNPLFGLSLTLGVYVLSDKFLRKYKLLVLNPLVLSIVVIILFLHFSGISYKDYNIGGNFLTMLITPATVALAIPLYKNFRLLKENFYPVMAAILAGIVANCLVSVGFGYFFSLHKEMVISLLPKSVTTAISVDLSHTMGGVNAVTLAIVVSTGIFGSLIATHIFRLFKIESPVARGVALGSTSHAIGTAKAIEIGEIEGIISGLAICVNGILTVLLLPLFFQPFAGLF